MLNVLSPYLCIGAFLLEEHDELVRPALLAPTNKLHIAVQNMRSIFTHLLRGAASKDPQQLPPQDPGDSYVAERGAHPTCTFPPSGGC